MEDSIPEGDHENIQELINADFGEVNELRNIVFQFRRRITPKATDSLRHVREFYASKQQYRLRAETAG